jgi:hypothetical protein
LNLRAKYNLVRRISSPVHYHSANSPKTQIIITIINCWVNGLFFNL